MPEEIKAYRCSFHCGRIRRRPSGVAIHELTCFKNPARRACKTCKHEQIERDEVYTGHAWGEPTYSQGAPYRVCDKDALGELTIRSDCPTWEAKTA